MLVCPYDLLSLNLIILVSLKKSLIDVYMVKQDLFIFIYLISFRLAVLNYKHVLIKITF